LGKRNEKQMYKKGNKSEKKTRGESYSVLKKKTNNNNNNNKICKKWQFWKKRKTTKLDYQPAQYWRNKFDKDNFLKKYIGEFFFLKKNYKAKFSTSLI